MIFMDGNSSQELLQQPLLPSFAATVVPVAFDLQQPSPAFTLETKQHMQANATTVIATRFM